MGEPTLTPYLVRAHKHPNGDIEPLQIPMHTYPEAVAQARYCVDQSGEFELAEVASYDPDRGAYVVIERHSSVKEA